MTLAAVFFALIFHAPGDSVAGVGVEPVASYQAERRVPGGAWAPATLYGGPSVASGPAVPNAPGAPDSAWASLSNAPAAWLAGGEEYRLRSVDRAGNRSSWSNFVVVVAGPDTVWTIAGVKAFDRWAKVGTFAGWKRDTGDTLPGARAVHFEEVQRAHRATLCGIFGFWALRGLREPCP